MSEELKENVKDSGAWLRLLYMLLFAVIYSVAEIVITAVVIFQFLCVLISGEKNARVLALGAQLATYAYQVFSFLTYNSEEKPFPFGDWPSDRPLAEIVEKKPAARRGRPRKSADKPKDEPASPDA